MPDVSGWPTADECLRKIEIATPAGMSVSLADDVPNLLLAAIAEFEGPIGIMGSGGTGRSFTPVVDTRKYDGTGYPELVVDDIVPTASYVVTVFDTTLTTVTLKQAVQGRGWNVLCFPNLGMTVGNMQYPYAGRFTLGKQNITVAATFGYAAQVPKDVWEAVRCEVAYRGLVQAVVGLAGIGSNRTFGSWKIDNTVDADIWASSSSLSLYHKTFMRAIQRYRVPKTRIIREIAMGRRMS